MWPSGVPACRGHTPAWSAQQQHRRPPCPAPPRPPRAARPAARARAGALRRDLGAERLNMPQALVEEIRSSNEEWVRDALASPLVHPATGRRIYLASSCAWAPFGWEVVRAVMEEAKPTLVLLEQPPPDSSGSGTSSGSGDDGSSSSGGGSDSSAAPAWVQAFLDAFDSVVSEENLSPSLPSRPPAAPAAEAALGALRARLAAAGAPAARVGRFMLDPDEAFGFYAHNELARFPECVLDAWQLLGEWGYLPGMEHVAAAQLAARAGAPLRCADAPLPLQERWVAAMVAAFERRRAAGAGAGGGAGGAGGAGAGGAPLPFELLRDSHALQARLPPGFSEWDERLAAAFADAGPQSLLAFRVGRACAAAALGPHDAAAAITRLRRLQPLKWEHFARRELYMAWQMREACEAGAPRQVRRAEAEAGSSGTGGEGSGGGGSSGGGGGGDGAVVALVGRQHVAALRALWEDKGSPLWRDAMPREFSPSVIDEFNARAEAAAEVAAAGGEAAAAAGVGEAGADTPP